MFRPLHKNHLYHHSCQASHGADSYIWIKIPFFLTKIQISSKIACNQATYSYHLFWKLYWRHIHSWIRDMTIHFCYLIFYFIQSSDYLSKFHSIRKNHGNKNGCLCWYEPEGQKYFDNVLPTLNVYPSIGQLIFHWVKDSFYGFSFHPSYNWPSSLQYLHRGY